MNNLDDYNELLLQLYELAITASPQTFQTATLKLVEQIVGFDRAWWGIMAPSGGGFDLCSSHRYELPDEFETQWEAIKSDDSLARDAHWKPRTTINFDEKGLRSTPGLAELNEGHDLRHALCTSIYLRDRKSFLFISLFRSGSRAKAFGVEDVKMKQLMTPHLYAAWRANLLADLQRKEPGGKFSNKAAAFVDRRGMIVCANSSFATMLSEKWPSWGGRRLPATLFEALRLEPTSSHTQTHDLRVGWRQEGGLICLEVGRSSPIDKLTPREREIAEYFAQAQSYKEIAIRTSLSPLTVRHHLRTIYSKLEIEDKAQLVRLIDKFQDGISVSANSYVAPATNSSGTDFLGLM